MQMTTESSFSGIPDESLGTSSVGSQILENFKDSKEYRDAFVEETVRTQIAAQIRAIREQRRLSRPSLARKMGKSPSWVFRLEDPNEAPPTVTTLLQVARAYDVNLEIRFSPFLTLINGLDADALPLEVPSFEEELEALSRIDPKGTVDTAMASGNIVYTTTAKGRLAKNIADSGAPPQIRSVVTVTNNPECKYA